MMNYLTVLATAALLLGACTKGLGWEEEQNGGLDTPEIPTTGELVLTADKTDVEIGGIDFAQLTVTKGGVEVPASMYDVYEEIKDNNGDIKSVLIACSEGKYKPEKMGNHDIKVFYRRTGEFSDTIRFRAKKQSTPSGVDPGPAPDDNSNKLNFKRRVLMIQFTGTTCGACPYMINTLKSMMEDPAVSENSILVAAHRYDPADPAYMSQALDQNFGITNYPSLNFDMYTTSTQSQRVDYNTNLLNQCLQRVKVRGGISAVSLYDSTTKTVTISAKVKAAEESDFRIGAMLIEDNIVATQYNFGAPGDWTNFVHNNSIRYCDGEYALLNYSGHSLGTIEKGATAEHTFTINVKSSWKVDDCRLVLYITTPEIIGTTRMYLVNNAITLPLTGEKGFEYTE